MRAGRMFSEKRQTGKTLIVGIARNRSGFYDSKSLLADRIRLPVFGGVSQV